MARGAAVLRISGLALAFVAVASCGGKKVRLGDAAAGSDATIAGVGGGAFGGSSNGGGRSTGGATSSGGSEAGAPCQRGRVKANEVVWIGDTWITVPGIQHTRVRDFAVDSEAIGQGEDYVVLAAPSVGMEAIANQYRAREAGTPKVKVLIMDGGTWDTIVANGSDASVTSVVSSFERLLASIASDGTVEHVIYFLQPELPSIPGVAALRPPLQQACADSTVPCHFLDLQPLWAGHPEYSDGIQASVAGGSVIADSIWSIMQDECIAQ